MVYTNATDAFYLVQSRAWELSIGAFIAILGPPPLRGQWTAQLVAGAGIVLIAASVLFINEHMRFPGLTALPPCLGAAAIIYSGAHVETFVGKFLSLPAIRFTGLISYSLYLWHWPVYVFYKSVENPGKIESICLIALCFVLATLSWKYVEQPFRKLSSGTGKFNIVLAGAAGLLATTLCAALLVPVSSAVWRPSAEAKTLDPYLTYNVDAEMSVGKCFLTSQYSDFSLFRKQECLRQDDRKLNVLIMGDSHSAHLVPGFRAAYPDVNVMQASASGCVPVLNPSGEVRCRDLINYMISDYLPENHVDVIVLSGKWDGRHAAAAVETAKRLQNYAKKVYLFGPNQEYDSPLPRLLLRAILTHDSKLVSNHLDPAQRLTDIKFKHAAQLSGVQYVSVFDIFCKTSCTTRTTNQVPILFDTGHFTVEGAAYLVDDLKTNDPDFLPLETK